MHKSKPAVWSCLTVSLWSCHKLMKNDAKDYQQPFINIYSRSCSCDLRWSFLSCKVEVVQSFVWPQSHVSKGFVRTQLARCLLYSGWGHHDCFWHTYTYIYLTSHIFLGWPYHYCDALFICECICLETEDYTLFLPSAAKWLDVVWTCSGSCQLLQPKETAH